LNSCGENVDELKACMSGLPKCTDPRVDATTAPGMSPWSAELRALDDVLLEFDKTEIVEPGVL